MSQKTSISTSPTRTFTYREIVQTLFALVTPGAHEIRFTFAFAFVIARHSDRSLTVAIADWNLHENTLKTRKHTETDNYTFALGILIVSRTTLFARSPRETR